MITVKAPGKLFLSGEWSVLENQPAIVIAVDSKSIAKIEAKKETTISSPRFGIEKIKCIFDGNKFELLTKLKSEKETMRFISSAAEVCLKYLSEQGIQTKDFSLTTDSDKNSIQLPDGSFAKLGFGSSAAITVAVIGAIFELHQKKISQHQTEIYKLAAIAHFLGQGKLGSAADISASVWGGLVYYKKFDAQWLQKELKENNFAGIVEKKWPNFFAQKIPAPKNLELIVAFSGQSSFTKPLVEKMNSFKEKKRKQYFEIIDSIGATTELLFRAIKAQQNEKILELIQNNRNLLLELEKKSENTLETKQLSKIIDLMQGFGAAAKFSGAGGGDCAIGICFLKQLKQKIMAQLKENGLNPLQINICEQGVTRVE